MIPGVSDERPVAQTTVRFAAHTDTHTPAMLLGPWEHPR